MYHPIMPILIFQVAAFVGALGQLLYKKATMGCIRRLRNVIYLLAGMGLYVAVTLLFLLAYRLGGAMSVLYPTYAATFVWGLLLARLFFKETVNAGKILGTLCVTGGVCLVTL